MDLLVQRCMKGGVFTTSHAAENLLSAAALRPGIAGGRAVARFPIEKRDRGRESNPACARTIDVALGFCFRQLSLPWGRLGEVHGSAVILSDCVRQASVVTLLSSKETRLGCVSRQAAVALLYNSAIDTRFWPV